MLRATGTETGRSVDLAVAPGTEGDGNLLYYKTPADLWDITGPKSSLNHCFQVAADRFGVAPDAWSDGAFTTADVAQAYAMDAIEMARQRFHVELDLSPASLEQVERILGQVYDQRPRGLGRLFRKGPSADEVSGMAKVFGCYIGEVFRRQHGGAWTNESKAFPGEEVVTLQIGNVDIYPPAKAYKRLTNGPEENVVFYYKVFREKLLK